MGEVRCTYKFRGFEAEYNPPPKDWAGCQCTLKDNELIVTTSHVCTVGDKDSIRSALMNIQTKMDRIGYYLMFKSNPRLIWEKDSHHDVLNDDGEKVSSDVIVMLDSAEAFIYGTREFPNKVPELSATALRNIHIYVFAKRLEDQTYIGDRIRSYFNIIEERWEASGRDLNDTDYNDVRLARNFVSHPHCTSPSVIEFVRARLPSAVKRQSGQEYTEYDPSNVKHRNAVSKLEGKARQLSLELINELLGEQDP